MSQKLTFTTACLFNTTVSNATDVIYYDIQTPEWEPHLTTVRRLDHRTGLYELAGSIRNEVDKPASVSLYGGAFEPVEQWIKKVDGTKPGERWECHLFLAYIYNGCVVGRSWESWIVVGGNSMTEKETCSHGA